MFILDAFIWKQIQPCNPWKGNKWVSALPFVADLALIIEMGMLELIQNYVFTVVYSNSVVEYISPCMLTTMSFQH